MFHGGFKGPCPICGAAELSCGGGGAEPRGVIGAGFFTGGSPMAVSRWRSRESVTAPDPVSGRTVQLYGIGTPIPAIEALRQGVATWEEMDAGTLAALAAHGVTPPGSADPEPGAAARKGKGKGPDRPEKDKMVREGSVVRK